MIDADGNPHGDMEFNRMPQGAGGYNICGGQSADGDVFATGVDVYGVWIKNSASGIFQLLTDEAGIPVEADRFPTTTGDIKNGDLQFSGCKGLYFAPSNSNRMVFWWRGAVYVCDNAKAARPTATLTTLQDKHLPTNEINNRGFNDIIAVHPTNDDIWIAGTFNDGVYYTTDAGDTWHTISIGAGGTGYNGFNMFYLVAFDPTDGNKVYIVRAGSGVYRSTTGVSGAFTLMSGSPLYAFSMTVDVNGTVWLCDPSATGTTPALHKCVSGTWSAVEQQNPTATSKCVAVNPLNPLEIVTSEDWINNYQHSTDGGTTWQVYSYGDTVPHTGLVGTAEYEWMVGGPVLASRLWFDPIEDGKLWASHGGGLAWSTVPVSSPWQWNDVSLGMECQVANNTLSVPGLPPLFFSWDTAIWRGTPSLDSFAKIPQNTLGQSFISNAWAGDYAADDHNYIVVAGSQTAGGDLAGYSEDGGVTFQGLLPTPYQYPDGSSGGYGGTIAVNRRVNQMIAPGNNLNAIYTKNEWGRYTGTSIKGVDWDYLNPMDPGTPLGYWANNVYGRIDTIAADKTRAGVFAVRLNYYQSPGQGIWITYDGGDSFTQTVVGQTDAGGDPLDFGTARLEYIPGKSGEFILGDTGWNPSHLLYYTDDGLSGPTQLGNIDYVAWWRLGGTFPGRDYPCLYFYGSVAGDSLVGLYRMDDIFSDPVFLTNYPLGSFDGVSTVGADVNDPTLVYFGWSGSGFGYGKIYDWATGT